MPDYLVADYVGGDLGGDLRESGSGFQDPVGQERKQPGADALGRMVAGRGQNPARFEQRGKFSVLEHPVLLREVVGERTPNWSSTWPAATGSQHSRIVW